MSTPLVKALAVSIAFVGLCFLLNSVQRDLEVIRILLVIMTFPGFFIAFLAGMGVHDFEPAIVFPINGLILFAIVYSALRVKKEDKTKT